MGRPLVAVAVGQAFLPAISTTDASCQSDSLRGLPAIESGGKRPVAWFFYELRVDRIVFDVLNDSRQLIIIANAMVVGFVLPKCSGPTKHRVRGCLNFFNGQRYYLLAYVIM